MYKRELHQKLEEWKDNPHRKPLVLRGARQVGKTTLVKEFGKSFDHFITLNLELNADAEIFRNNASVDEIIDYLFLRHHIQKDQHQKILLFIDEIQEEEAAIATLRYFYEEMPWLYVIAAGSRLQTLIKKHISFPVGRVEYLTLRPFTFLEYIEAVEGDEWGEKIRQLRVESLLHQEMMNHFNRYALIGGMPEAVAHYAQHQDLAALSPIYRSLQTGYAEDVERYSKGNNQTAVMRHILRYGWAAAGQAVTFNRFAGSSYTSTQVHEAMDVLQRAFILALHYPITSTSAPAIPATSRQPKLTWVDSGLVNFFAGIQTEFLQNKDLLDTWRGNAAEQIVAQELRVVLDRHFHDEQYYWMRDKKGTSAEVDFIWQSGTRIIPIEVKAGTNSHFRSLHSFVNLSSEKPIAIRVWSGEYNVQEVTTPAPNQKPYTLVNLPFYYVGQLDKIIKELLR